MASICFRNLLKTVCFDCEMILFWQNLRKAVCFGQNVFFFFQEYLVKTVVFAKIA